MAVAGIEADRVASFFTEGSVTVLSDETGEESCGHAAGFDDDDASGDFRKIRDHARNLG